MGPAGWLRLVVVVGFFAALEVLCRTGVIDPFTMIAPSEMVLSLAGLVQQGKVASELAFTLGNMVMAIVLAIATGFTTGVILHSLPRLRRVVDPLLGAYYAVPHFIFYPILVVIFGLGRLPLIVIGAVFGVVAMIVNTMDGFDRIPRVFEKTSRAYRLDPLRTIFLIRLPAALPHLMTGIKLAVTYCMIGVVAGEFILSLSGIGRSIAFAYNDLDNRSMYGLLLLLLTITTTVNVTLQLIEQSFYRRWGRA